MIIRQADVEQRLRDIEERASKASPGPWRAVREASADETACGYDLYSLDGPTWLEEGDYAYLARNDAEFAAHARDDIPWLLSLIRELDAENRRLRERLDRLESGLRALVAGLGGGSHA